MDIPDDEAAFLSALVKASRQKPHMVPWIDRDGTGRHTPLSPADSARLAAIAARLRIAKSEVLRQAAHIPVEKAPRKPKPAEPPAGP